MNFDEVYHYIERLGRENHRFFVKAVIGFEKGINDSDLLDKVYNAYMQDDEVSLLSDEIDELIDRCGANENWGWGDF